MFKLHGVIGSFQTLSLGIGLPNSCITSSPLKFWPKLSTPSQIYVMIYEDEKIECGKWQATITATSDTATIKGTIQTLISLIGLFLGVGQPGSSSKSGLPLKTFDFLDPRIS